MVEGISMGFLTTTRIANLKNHQVTDKTIAILSDLSHSKKAKSVYYDLFKLFLSDFEKHKTCNIFFLDTIHDLYSESKPIRSLYKSQINKILLILCHYDILLTHRDSPSRNPKPFSNMSKSLMPKVKQLKSRCFILNSKVFKGGKYNIKGGLKS